MKLKSRNGVSPSSSCFLLHLEVYMLTDPRQEKNTDAQQIASPLLCYKNQQHPQIAALGGNFLMGSMDREEILCVWVVVTAHHNQQHQVKSL